MDVKLLQINTLNQEGIKAVKETLTDQADQPIVTKVIIKFPFLTLTLTYNISMI